VEEKQNQLKMARINKEGYVEIKVYGVNNSSAYTDEFPIKKGTSHNGLYLNVFLNAIPKIYINKKYIGKKVKLKLEVLEEEDEDKRFN
jgi:hypothetical protein